MKEIITQIDESMQIAKSKDGRYLTFAFLERDHGLELEVVGWKQLHDSTFFKGVINLWGNEIPIKQHPFFHDQDPATMCIVVFEYREPLRHYLAATYDAISNVMTIAEKDPTTVSIVETEAFDCFGGSQVQYNIVERVRDDE